jgi:hypothetical protein
MQCRLGSHMSLFFTFCIFLFSPIIVNAAVPQELLIFYGYPSLINAALGDTEKVWSACVFP